MLGQTIGIQPEWLARPRTMPWSDNHLRTVSSPVSVSRSETWVAVSASSGTTPRAVQIWSKVNSRPGWNSTSRAANASRPGLRLTDPGMRKLRTALVAPGSV